MKTVNLKSLENVHTHYVYQINNSTKGTGLLVDHGDTPFKKWDPPLKINKTEQGITIISLVVTVIILLILAGVAIRTISGDNGLISRTKQTVEESKKAEYREGLDTIGLGVKLKTAGDDLSSAEYMDEYLEELNKEKTKEGSLFKESNIKRKNDETIRVETKEGYIYYVREDEIIYAGKVGEVDEGNIAELRKADIIFSYSHETWTKEDVQVTISLSETVQNKENYRIEYSKDNRNWSKYAEGTTITMIQNGKVYARTKDISGDIKLEGGYAEGEVTVIDKKEPSPGTLVIKQGNEEGKDYEEGKASRMDIYVEPKVGIDEPENDIYESSGSKEAIYNVEGPISLSNQAEPTLLTKEGEYTITVKTVDNAGNISEARTYTAELKGITATDIKNDSNKAYYYGKTISGYECPNGAGVPSWKLFYSGENPGIETDNIYIITSDYINYDYLPKAGSNALYIAKDKYHLSFENVVKSYSGSSNVTDPRIRGLNNDYYTKGRTSTAINARAVAYMLDINIWNNAFKGNNAEYAIGGPTIELFFKSYNEKYNTNCVAVGYTNSGYSTSYDGGKTWGWEYSNSVIEKNDNLYMVSNEKNSTYWLASMPSDTDQGIIAAQKSSSNSAYFITVATYHLDTGRGGFRPVVCLNTEVKLKELVNGNFAIIE